MYEFTVQKVVLPHQNELIKSNSQKIPLLVVYTLPLPATGYRLLERPVIGLFAIMETMGDRGVCDPNAPGYH